MDINVVGIYLDESTYKGVYILDIVGTSHDFSTGNPVKDFVDALKFAKKSGHETFYSSSIDNFIRDDGRYYLKNRMLCRRAKAAGTLPA